MLPEYLVLGQLGLVVVIEVFTIIVVWAYLKQIKQNQELQRRMSELEKVVEGEKEKLLAEAKVEAEAKLKQAQIQAEQMIREAQLFGQESNVALTKMLDGLSEKQVEVSNQVIGRVRDETVTLLQELVANLKEHAAGELDKFGEELKQEFVTARQAAQKTIDEAYGTATREVEAYKETRLKQVKQEMTILVREVVEKVLNKSIDERQHEQLVLEAMEEAKQDGIL